MTNPVANGIPVRLLPPELLAAPKNDKVTIPLEWLRQSPPDTYRLAPRDTLGIFIDDVLGGRDQLPPFDFPGADLPVSVGFPVPVVEDGTLLLPLVEPVNVDGMSIAEAKEAIIEAYTVKQEILDPGSSRFLVSIFRPRTIRVLVLRQDSPEGSLSFQTRGPLNRAGVGGFQISREQSRGTGTVVNLPAYQNDLLTALTQTGGLPGIDAVNEVVIRRGGFRDGVASGIDWSDPERITRVPLRMRPGTPRPFSEEDIILNDGDIVLIQERVQDTFFTAGLLQASEIPLPRDADLSVVEAMIQSQGLLLRGGVGGNNLAGNISAGGIGDPSPSLLTVIRRAEDGRQIPIRVNLSRAVRDPRENILVRRGDILALQWAPDEAVAKYFKDIISVSFFGTILARRDATITGQFGLP